MLPAVELNVVVAEPAGTVMLAVGTGRKVLLLDRETAVPPAGAAWLRVKVQVVLAREIKLVGVQDNEDKTMGVPELGTKLMVAIWDTPLRVAVSVAL
jgi:hypothetical protein